MALNDTLMEDMKSAMKTKDKETLTVIDRYDMYDIEKIVSKSDPYAFMSISQVTTVHGRFVEQKPV